LEESDNIPSSVLEMGIWYFMYNNMVGQRTAALRATALIFKENKMVISE